MNPSIRRETGRATYEEILRLRLRVRDLEDQKNVKTEALIRTGSRTGPVGGLTTTSADGRYLRLDASNDPVTGSLSLSSGLSVAGATDLTTLLASGVVTHSSTLVQTGLSTFSDMLHSAAPTAGVANIRLRSGVSYSTISPDDETTLSGHELWMDASSITASGGGEVVRWESGGSPFSGDGFTDDGTGPTYDVDGEAANNSQPFVYNDGSGGYLDSGTDHLFSGACTVFLVYRPSTSAAFAAERACGGANTDSDRSGFRPPGTAAAGSAEFSIRDKDASGAGIRVSQTTLTTGVLDSADWHIAAFRRDSGNEWFCLLDTNDESGSVIDNVIPNIKAFMRDTDQSPGTNFALAEFVGYTADLGTTNTELVYNYLAEKYGLATIANGGGGAGANQTDHILCEDSGGTEVFSVDTAGNVIAAGGLTVAGNTVLSGTLAVTGALTGGSAVFNTITVTHGDFQTLQVDGKVTTSDSIDSGSTISGPIVRASRDSTANAPRLYVRDEKGTANLDMGVGFQASNDSSKAFLGFNSSNNFRVENKFNNLMRFYTGGNERLRVSSTFLDVFVDAKWNDNKKLVLGNGQDARIYFDNTNLIVEPQNVGSGDLKVQGGAFVDVASPGYLRSGSRLILTAGKNNLGADSYMAGPDGVDMTANHGHMVPRTGSVLSIAVSNDRAVMSGEDTITYSVRKNGTDVATLVVHSTVSNTYTNFARDVNTFSAGDVLSMHADVGASWNGNVNVIFNTEIVVDD